MRARQDAYVVTHPLTQDRITFVRKHVENSSYSGNELPERAAMHGRMVAKLRGFINPPSQTLAEYSADDTAVSARYARTMAYYRDSDQTRP